MTAYQDEILDLYEDAEHDGEESKERRFNRWRIIQYLKKDLNPNFMAKIRENVATAFFARHIYAAQLRNIHDDKVIVYYTNHGSLWFKKWPRQMID